MKRQDEYDEAYAALLAFLVVMYFYALVILLS